MAGARARVVLLASLALAGCGSGGDGGRENGGAKRGGTLEILSFIDVDSVDPGRVYSVGGYPVVLQVHRPLYTFTRGRSPVPDLAEAPPEVAPDGRTVTVRIRRGVRFGAPVRREVVAADVRHAIERGFRASVANPYARAYFGDIVGAAAFAAGRAAHISGIELPDRHTLVFRLARPRGSVLAGALAMPLTAPVPAEVTRDADRGRASSYDRRAVPTGPYRVAEYKPGSRTVLERNPDYEPAGDFRRALPDRIVWSVRPELAVAARQVLAGSGRLFGPGPPPPREILRDIGRGRHEDRTGVVATTGTYVYAFDTRRPPFDDLDVRRAVIAGVDRRALQLSWGGDAAGALATHYLPPILPGFAEAGGAGGPRLDFLARPEGDPAVAARYLRRAGFGEGRLRGSPIDLVTPVGLDVGRVLQGELEQLGFEVRLRELESGAAFARCAQRATRAHICFSTWGADFFDAETFLAPVLDPEAINPEFTLNYSELRDPRLAAAVERAKAAVDPATRARAWAQVDRTAIELAAALPMLWPRNALLRSRDVRADVSPWTGWWDLSTAGITS